jgi:2-polyprenyl-3-methyl-5-hydroxy-6-metoxy-1,4-benzoquinol methylase
MMRVYGDSTDDVWKTYGRDDPYFGVLAHAEYTRANLSDENLEKFFQSGEAGIAELLSSIEQSGISLRTGRALDFGCGVGRLAIPLAKRFREVIGVDVSEGMLAEAVRNVRKRNIENVNFSTELPNLEFDLVHSALVFQHINPVRGLEIISNCWSRVAQDGTLAVQVPIRFNGSRTIWRLRQVRNVFPVLQIPYNLLSGDRWNRPGMQMNIYNLNALSASLLELGARQLLLLRQPPDGPFSRVYVLAVKGSPEPA